MPPLSGGSSIGAHVSEAAKQPSRPTRSVGNLLGAHSIDDAIWGDTDPCDVLIDTMNSAEIMASSHITEENTFTFRRSDQHKLLNIAANVPRKDGPLRYYEPDFLVNYHD